MKKEKLIDIKSIEKISLSFVWLESGFRHFELDIPSNCIKSFSLMGNPLVLKTNALIYSGIQIDLLEDRLNEEVKDNYFSYTKFLNNYSETKLTHISIQYTSGKKEIIDITRFQEYNISTPNKNIIKINF